MSKVKKEEDKIVIRGARTHNLKNIDLELPRNKMIIFTGLSGSGKSSLAFDTIFAEGQRRYVESLSPYARQFLTQLQKPDVDEISGLSPAIAIDQKTRSNNPRSTVATITEIYDYLRVLYARVGQPHCIECGSRIQKLSNEEIISIVLEKVKALKSTTKKVKDVEFSLENIQILAPIVRGRKGEYYQLLYEMLGKGYTEVVVDGVKNSLRERVILDKNKKHNISIVVDQIGVDEIKKNTKDARTRLSEAIENSLKETDGLVEFLVGGESVVLSNKFACANCGFSFPEVEPRLFSFNSPYGACPTCNGLGVKYLGALDECEDCGGKRLRKEALNVFLKTQDKSSFVKSEKQIIGISGFGGSGKTTISKKIGNKLNIPVVSVDSFQKVGVFDSKYKLWEIMDYERLEKEVIIPFLNGDKKIKYGHCDGVKKEPIKYIEFENSGHLIIEGVGIFRQEILKYLNYKIWIDCDLDEAIKRGKKRDKEVGQAVVDKLWDGLWKKNEEECFKEFSPIEKADFVFSAKLESQDADLDEVLKRIISFREQKINIVDVTDLTISEAKKFFESIELTDKEREIAKVVLKEIETRLVFLLDVGLDYLNLNRRADTLSGGEAQRIRLASQLGSQLVGALYVLDEPTIGLHQRDNDRLIETLLKLRDLGNTILVVEHDEDTALASDFLVDIGPGAGVHGGHVVVADDLQKLLDAPTNKSKSITLSYLRGEEKVYVPKERRDKDFGKIEIKGGEVFNIKDLNVKIPLGRMTTITGVSGSGKSTLMYEIIHRNLEARLERKTRTAQTYNCESFTGVEGNLSRTVLIDQSPIGRTPRSNPATYTGAWTHIRDIFAATEESRIRGWKPSRFSFNVEGGRCEACQGNGEIAVEMHFLPTVYVECDVCRGQRFMKETLEVKYKGKNVFEVLNMTVEEAAEFFQPIPAIYDRMKSLLDVGLGYLKLGQSATTLSGGEAQRVKISSELYRPHTERTIYLLDEPTVGLHFEDVRKLIEILNKLVDKSNTVMLIEHNLDVIKCSDWLIDIGPEGGVGGGRIVAQGTPEMVANSEVSRTGKYLKKILKRDRQK
jgi:excinuclease ABC subunit A